MHSDPLSQGLSTGDFEGARRFAWQDAALGLDHRPARTLGRTSRALEQTRSFGQALRLLWVDGIHVQAAGGRRAVLLVIIGATRRAKRACWPLDGVRESRILAGAAPRSQAAWACDRPELAVADGALGFWQAVEDVWPKMRGQRCWVHKTANVLNKLPKSQQSKAKRALQEIRMAETKRCLVASLPSSNLGRQIRQGGGCLVKDRDALLAFYTSGRAWKHLRTTNPIEARSRRCATDGALRCLSRPRSP